jgi:hypothetical protein
MSRDKCQGRFPLPPKKHIKSCWFSENIEILLFWTLFVLFSSKFFIKSIFAISWGWFFGSSVKIRCFMKGLWHLFSRFFFLKTKAEFLENMWFYLIKPYISQKFSFLHFFFRRKKNVKKSFQSSFIKHRILTLEPQKQTP